MSISKETELIIKLKHLPGFGPKTVEVVAKAMIECNLFSDNDIVSYVQECIKTHYIRLNKELTPDLFQKAIDEAQRVLGNIYGVAETIMTGKHDYRNVTIYKDWNTYSKAHKGNGRMLKYRR
mgnify:CR=1 FL=1